MKKGGEEERRRVHIRSELLPDYAGNEVQNREGSGGRPLDGRSDGGGERSGPGRGSAEAKLGHVDLRALSECSLRCRLSLELFITDCLSPSGVMEPVEDPMEIETEIVVPASNSPIRETDNVLENVTSVVLDPLDVPAESPSDQGHHVIQPPSVTDVEEAPVPTAELVTVSTDVVTSTSMDTTIELVTITKENQEISVETRTIVEVTTTTASASEEKSTFLKPIELGDSDSDGPLPAIVDGGPDSDSDWAPTFELSSSTYGRF